MRRFDIEAFFALCVVAAAPLMAQQTAEPPADLGNAEGVPDINHMGAHLYSISVFGDYFSSGLPANFSTPTGNLQSDIAYGASASMGWVKSGPGLNFSVYYAPTYTGRMRYSDLNSFGHDLNLSSSLQLNPKWTLRVGATGAIRDLQRVLFSSTQASQLASNSTSFNGLASSVVAGQYANSQVASILTSPSVVSAAAGNILYGDRYLTAAINMGVTYARSERFQLNFGVIGSRSQALPSNSSTSVAQPVLPRTTTGGANVSLNYGLTSRLNLSANWAGQEALQYRQGNTTYGNSLVHNVTTSIGYVASAKWLFTLGGGIGYVPSATRSAGSVSQNTPGGTRYLGNGSIVYKFFSQTLTATGSRAVSNAYGLGGGAMVTGDLAWHWNRPGSYWAMSVDGGYQSYEVQGGSPLSGWRGMASLNRMLTPRLSIGADYSLLRNIGLLNGVNYALTRGAAQVTLTWSFTDQRAPGRNDSNF